MKFFGIGKGSRSGDSKARGNRSERSLRETLLSSRAFQRGRNSTLSSSLASQHHNAPEAALDSGPMAAAAGLPQHLEPPASPSLLSHVDNANEPDSTTSTDSGYEHLSNDSRIQRLTAARPESVASSDASSLPIIHATDDPDTPSLITPLVKAAFLVTINDADTWRSPNIQLPWQDAAAQWKKYQREARSEAQKLAQRSAGTFWAKSFSRIYLRTGSAHLIQVKDSTESRSCFLESQRDWAHHLNRLVADWLLRHPDVEFRVEIRWNYSVLTLRPDGKGSLGTEVRNALEAQSEQNWEHRPFIPCKVLKCIFDRPTVSNLLQHDASLTGRFPCNRWNNITDFAEYVYLNAVALLGLFIYVKVELNCLFEILLTHEENDLPVVNRPFHENDCPQNACKPDFRLLQNSQHQFRAHTFKFDASNRRSTYDNLDAHTVVPIIFNKDDKRSLLGEGSFGEVYKVKVHSDHHKFHSNRSLEYALKIFKIGGRRGARDFQLEETALRKLASTSDDYLVIHFAAWTQNDTFFMLFPCAEKNLRSHLCQPSPKLGGVFITGLLKELHDVSNALVHIHKLAPAKLGHPRGDLLHPQSGMHRSTGFHFDLRPENILIFWTDQEQYPVWKVSDFGTARICDIVSGSKSGGRQYQSHKTASQNKGDPVYWAPDHAQRGESSRPYDIWSLGCIFLEVLMWALKQPGWEEGKFARERVDSPPTLRHPTEAFWYQFGLQIAIKPVVLDKIQNLKIGCAEWGVLPDLIQLISDMLRLRPEQRPKAAVVRDDLEALMQQAGEDLIDDPTFYDRPRRRSRSPVAAPPSESGSRLREGSVDRGTVTVEMQAQLPRREEPQTPTHRRNASFESTPDNDRSDLDSQSAIAKSGAHLGLDTSLPFRHRSRSPSVTVRSPDGYERLEVEESPIGNVGQDGERERTSTLLALQQGITTEDLSRK